MILFTDIGQQIFAKLLRVFNFVGIRTTILISKKYNKSDKGGYSRYMQVHWLIALFACARFHKAGTTAFDLDPATSFLLNMFHIRTGLTDNLCT